MSLKFFSFSKFMRLMLLCSLMFNIHAAKAQEHIYPPETPRWEADSLGNQRAVIKVNKKTELATVAIGWRNRNVNPEQLVYVVDSTTNKMVDGVDRHYMGPEKGIVSFDPVSGPGTYYMYYLPYHLGGRSNSYPDAEYKMAQPTESVADKDIKLSKSKEATLVRFEAVDTFNTNEPMEIIATKEEVADFKSRHPEKEFIIFPEKRDFPIKMWDYLPQKWMQQDTESVFSDKVNKGEYFTFQLGVWPLKGDMKDVGITFSDLLGDSGAALPATVFTCFNTEGISYAGNPMHKTIAIPKEKLQSLWIGAEIPADIASGTYKGTVKISSANMKAQQVPIELHITEEQATDGGIGEPWKQTRLHWINSTLAQENTVIEPYLPLEVSGNTVSLLGRKVIIGSNGLPEQIQSYFTEEMTAVSNGPKNILVHPFQFKIKDKNGKEISMETKGLSFQKKEPGTVTWHSKSTSPQLTMQVEGTLEFDGFANFQVKVTANQDLDLQDIALEVPMHKQASKYMLGLGRKGGNRPQNINWKWDVAHKNQDGLWLGAVNAGLQLTLRDERYERPLNTNFYLQKPLVLPSSWGNGDKGGIEINERADTVTVNNYSGPRKMKKGEELFYNFTLLITPFHTLQTDAQWSQRYFHSYKPVDSVSMSGSNVVNIHHANEINPYINYPFIATKKMKAYVDEAHSAGLKVKIYNTVREVSNRLYELYPLMSLGHEVFSPGDGGGYSWLQEHLQDDYIAAWYVPRFQDAAIINSGMNRWHNYYVEGMNWLVQHIGIDGIYLDDVAFDRITMKRIKRVLTQNGAAGIIDLHSANQYNERDGFNNSAQLYMEHFPYINRLWFGEYFDYEKESPDFYMTEVSGIPFGLMGEMLQDGGNPWRGMLYGMTNRMPYQEKKPDQIWKAWDSFGMQGSQMIGYWVSDSPVKTDAENVLATVYKKEGKALVSIASWASDDTTINLNIDWKALGIDPDKAKITAPEIKDFQPAAVFGTADDIPVKKNRGWLLIIE